MNIVGARVVEPSEMDVLENMETVYVDRGVTKRKYNPPGRQWKDGNVE